MGYFHTCGHATDGAWYCWGSNNYGQLGNGTTGPELCQGAFLCSTVPVAVAGVVSFATVFPGGRRHSCGLTSGGVAYCWGENIFGELGDGSTVNSVTPVAVAGGLTFASVSSYLHHTCGLTAAGVAYCWGRNSWGQLGNGMTGPEICLDIYWCSTVPARVAGQHMAAPIASVRTGGVDRGSSAPPSRRPPAP